MQRGFTLVELSIVLVIIGLLIGGLLVARSMILTATTHRIVKNFQQYEIAITNFEMSYKQFPGDSQYFRPAGDGDNNSNEALAGPACVNDSEYYNAFAHLSQANMIAGNFIPYCDSPANTTLTSNTNYGLVYPKLSETNVKYGGAYQGNKPTVVVRTNSNSKYAYFSFRLNPQEYIGVQKKYGFFTTTAQAQNAGGIYNLYGEEWCISAIDGSAIECVLAGDDAYSTADLYFQRKN